MTDFERARKGPSMKHYTWEEEPMYYVIYFENGCVEDSFKYPHRDEEAFIQEHIDRGAVKVLRRKDGVIVYEKEPN